MLAIYMIRLRVDDALETNLALKRISVTHGM